MADPAADALRVYRDRTLTPAQKKAQLESMISHAPEPDRGLSFDAYDDLGRGNERAEALEWMAPPQAAPAPSNAHVEGPKLTVEGLDAQRGRSQSEQHRRNKLAGSQLGTAARSAAVSGADLLMSPVTMPARALRRYGVKTKAADLSAEEALADVESLARDETASESRTRLEAGQEAHPDAAALGSMAGQFAAGAGVGGLARYLSGGSMYGAPVPRRGARGLLADDAGAVSAPSQRPGFNAQVESNPEDFFGPDSGSRFRSELLQRDAEAAAARPPVSRAELERLSPSRGDGFGLLDDALSGDPDRIAQARAATPSPAQASGNAALQDLPQQDLFAARSWAYAHGDTAAYEKYQGEINRRAGRGKPSTAPVSAPPTWRPSPQPEARPDWYPDSAHPSVKAVLPNASPEVLTTEGLNGLIGNPGTHSGMRSRTVVSGGRNVFSTETSLSNEAGEKVGNIQRIFRRTPAGKTVVGHELFVLDDAAKGKGVGKKILADQVAAYDKHGVDEIKLHAAWDGRSVWPKMGFDLAKPEQFPRYRKAFDDYLRKQGIDPATVPAQNITELARWRAPDARPKTVQTETPKGFTEKTIQAPSGDEFLLGGEMLDLKADLNGPSGDALRAYLGVPPKAARSGQPAATQASTSSARSSERLSRPASRGRSPDSAADTARSAVASARARRAAARASRGE